MTDLELATEKELVDELARRNSCVVVALTRDLNAQAETRIVWYRGGLIRAIGLTEVAGIHLRRDLERSIETSHDDVE